MRVNLLKKRINQHFGHVMNAKFKKFLLALVTVALGAMSSVAMADTSYNFSFSGEYGVSVSGGVITIDPSNNITNISGTVSGSYGNINGLITTNEYDNKFLLSGKSWLLYQSRYY